MSWCRLKSAKSRGGREEVRCSFVVRFEGKIDPLKKQPVDLFCGLFFIPNKSTAHRRNQPGLTGIALA